MKGYSKAVIEDYFTGYKKFDIYRYWYIKHTLTRKLQCSMQVFFNRYSIIIIVLEVNLTYFKDNIYNLLSIISAVGVCVFQFQSVI